MNLSKLANFRLSNFVSNSVSISALTAMTVSLFAGGLANQANAQYPEAQYAQPQYQQPAQAPYEQQAPAQYAQPSQYSAQPPVDYAQPQAATYGQPGQSYAIGTNPTAGQSIGTAQIPAGQYMLTNSSGQSVYLNVTQLGQMYVIQAPTQNASAQQTQGPSKFGKVEGFLQKGLGAYYNYKAGGGLSSIIP